MIKNFYTKSNLAKEFDIKLDTGFDTIKNMLTEKGYTVYSMKQKGNQLVPYHTHPSQEMVIVLSGRVRYIIEEEIVDLSEGDMIKIEPNSVHAMVGIDKNTIANLLIIFV